MQNKFFEAMNRNTRANERLARSNEELAREMREQRRANQYEDEESYQHTTPIVIPHVVPDCERYCRPLIQYTQYLFCLTYPTSIFLMLSGAGELVKHNTRTGIGLFVAGFFLLPLALWQVTGFALPECCDGGYIGCYADSSEEEATTQPLRPSGGCSFQGFIAIWALTLCFSTSLALMVSGGALLVKHNTKTGIGLLVGGFFLLVLECWLTNYLINNNGCCGGYENNSEEEIPLHSGPRAATI